MIGKISKSGSFKQLVEYLDKEESVVLGTNMYGQGSREITAEFMTIRDLNPSIKQPVLHASLSLLPGESLSDEQFREVCETWIEKMGFDLTKNQYLIVRHKDTEHEHAHLAINRIDMLTSKVVIDSFERYRSQEIIRQLEQNYDLEQVAPSWQTFKNSDQEIEQNREPDSRKGLTHEIEIAAIGNPTMPEFFHRLASRQIRAEVGFTRNGKPKGITYKVTDGEKIAGNALGKAYSFPGLQKYLKVNYDPTRDNRELAELVQSTQQHQELQQERAPAREELGLQTPQPLLETVSDQGVPGRKIQPIWETQYGIPTIEDLIKAIPENLKEPQAETPERDRRQREKASSIYQQWDSLTRAIYRVEDPKDIDPRIAFLMQSEQQTSNQITQVLAQSPAVQELLKRDRSYSVSYSEFCQAQANANQATWQPALDHYLQAVELERQHQEQQRIAKERQQQQQQERQHNLKLLGQWEKAAISLGRPASYIEQIREVTADYQRGLPLSEKTIAARQQDLAAKERQQQAQRQQGGPSL